MLKSSIYIVLLIILFLVRSTDNVYAQRLPGFDQAQPVLIPVKVKVGSGNIELRAGGQKIGFKGSLLNLDANTKAKPQWKVEETELTTFSANITAEIITKLHQVTWFKGNWERGIEREIQSTPLMDNVIFLRKNGVSFFLSLDFPYSKIDSSGISYPPDKELLAGENYAIHTLTIGACRLSGEKVGKFDRAEIEAVSAYIEKRFIPRFNRPMVLASGITNRMTDVREGRIFYSMFDNPTIALSPELVEKDLILNAEVGIEYYQAFEGVFDWPDQEKTGAKMQKLQDKAKQLGVLMGDYAVPQGLYCPHYNYSHRELNRPDWLILNEQGKQSGPECLAVPEYSKLLKDSLINHNRKYDLKLICLDFLNIQPCYAKNHKHLPGDTYQQIRSIVDIMASLNELDPDFLIWSNSGNWIDLMPKLTWTNQNVYLTDPHVREYSSHLNVLKLLGDGRREQMVSVHESHFVPYRNFTNYEYYLAPHSRLSDTKVFEYSFLQGLAVTPNMGLGELRSFLERIPSQDAQRVKTFVRHWLSFIRDNYEVWKSTKRIGDKPGVGAAEVYAHIKDNSGFLCFVNQNPFPTTTSVVMDGTSGLLGGTSFLLSEIYPVKGKIVEQSIPYARRGDTLNFILPANSVRIIEINEQHANQVSAQVYGLDAVVNKNDTGYKATFKLPQGKRVELGIVLPSNEAVEKLDIKQTPSVPMFTFPVSAKIISQRGNLARIEVLGPRELAPRELVNWSIKPGDLSVTLPSAEHSGFLGALVHNAFSEDYELQLDIVTKPNDIKNTVLSANKFIPPAAQSIPATGSMTYLTEFIMPFIEGYGQDRAFEDDAIVELAFADPNKVAEIDVLLNGKKVPVSRYRNPKQPAYESFYITLGGTVRPGKVALQVNVKYK